MVVYHGTIGRTSFEVSFPLRCFQQLSLPYLATLTIAEISGNHKGKKSLFLDHIKEAHKSGCELVKIQTYEADDLTLKSKEKNFILKLKITSYLFIYF